MRIPNSVFLDSAYAIALVSPRDTHHRRAQELSLRLGADRTPVVTTRAVMLEIGNALSARHLRSVALQLMDALEADSAVEIVSLSDELYADAYKLYRARPDKDWGMIDCVSFAAMQERGIVDALTSDIHFRQAGFRALLRADDGT